MDQHQERRRGHVHRSRRGSDRRGPERRNQPASQNAPGGRDQVDVEQIMRDIRARIAQRHGIELSNQQIQELAARRLESILDPRTVKPGLLDQLRRSAGERPPAKAPLAAPPYTFEEQTLYESHRGIIRFFRRLLNPLLKLLFNPNPLIHALNVQSRLNVEMAEREAERERRQTEWNALQFEIVQRLVTEVSRASLELQAQSMRVESLAAKVEFNERRVRGIEGTAHQPSRPASRQTEHVSAPPPTAAAPSPSTPDAAPTSEAGEGTQGEGARRRRRRRRGRRGGGAAGEAGQAVGAPEGTQESADGDSQDAEPAEIEMTDAETPEPEPRLDETILADNLEPTSILAETAITEATPSEVAEAEARSDAAPAEVAPEERPWNDSEADRAPSWSTEATPTDPAPAATVPADMPAADMVPAEPDAAAPVTPPAETDPPAAASPSSPSAPSAPSAPNEAVAPPEPSDTPREPGREP